MQTRERAHCARSVFPFIKKKKKKKKEVFMDVYITIIYSLYPSYNFYFMFSNLIILICMIFRTHY